MKESAQMANAKTKSVMQQIKEYITTHPQFTSKEVREAHPNIPPNQISTALWKLVMNKTLSKIGEGQYAAVLTDVNKSELPVPAPTKKTTKKKKPKPSAKKSVVVAADLEQELQEASQQVIFWRKEAQDTKKLMHELRKADERLNDAVAIIRYLEEKLVIAIQHDARNDNAWVKS